jgi:hypothetical protein
MVGLPHDPQFNAKSPITVGKRSQRLRLRNILLLLNDTTVIASIVMPTTSGRQHPDEQGLLGKVGITRMSA